MDGAVDAMQLQTLKDAAEQSADSRNQGSLARAAMSSIAESRRQA